MARKFFYVCGGLLMLALAFHAGAHSAGAQSGTAMDAAGFSGSNGYPAVVINRKLYYSQFVAGSVTLLNTAPIPGSAQVVACFGVGGAAALGTVILDNGEVWQTITNRWSLVTTFPVAGPVPTTTSSWGQVKARYR